MSVTSQVFTLFYAVLYGALFTITDKWRPLMGTFGNKGQNRLFLSVVLYGIVPVLYFLLAFSKLQRVSPPTFLNLLPSIFCVVPLVFFHFCWIWIVVPRPDRFYEKEHLDDKSLDAVITWTKNGAYTRCRFVVFSILLLLVLPLAVVFVLPLLQATKR